MRQVRVDFAALPWEEKAPGVRFKTLIRGNQRLRLVEFTNEFKDRDWCLKAHIGYVLEGELEITFDDAIERLAAGDGIFIAGGEQERHRAHVKGTLARLILVEEVA
jgi:ethanolamine utilization protein EutQ (cupin superfamily)